MKTKISISLCLLLTSCQEDAPPKEEPIEEPSLENKSHADVAPQYDPLAVSSLGFPDISKAFLGKLQLTKLSAGSMDTYSYATNTPLPELKARLLTFLGKGWKEFDPEDEGQEDFDEYFEEQMKALGQKPGSFSVNAFINPAYPGAMVGLGKLQMDLLGKDQVVELILLNSPGYAPGDKGKP